MEGTGDGGEGEGVVWERDGPPRFWKMDTPMHAGHAENSERKTKSYCNVLKPD